VELFDVYPLYDLKPVRGKGAYVYDEKGNAYLDFYGGHAVISIGHSHPHYIHRITDQLSQLAFYSNSIHNDLQVELAHLLGELSGCENYRLFLCNSGAEANENALKVASFHTGHKRVIAFEKAFHGRTSAAVNITASPSIQAPLNHGFPVEFLPLNDSEALRQSLEHGGVAAVIIEGIQGIGGIYVPSEAFLREARMLCDTYGAVLILDEIQSGYGRSGQFFAFQYSGIEPDLITIAKGMGNGFPIAGVLIHPKFQAKHGMLGTTFGGAHLACAAGLAVLEVIRDENLVENARNMGDWLLRELRAMPGIREVRGRGLMIGLEFDFPTGNLRKQLLFEHKVFTGSASNPNVVRLLPALNIGSAEVELFLEKFALALQQTTQTATV
jgi:acetylornithine/N-succinyldiaminopimelate aminotransferase